MLKLQRVFVAVLLDKYVMIFKFYKNSKFIETVIPNKLLVQLQSRFCTTIKRMGDKFWIIASLLEFLFYAFILCGF